MLSVLLAQFSFLFDRVHEGAILSSSYCRNGLVEDSCVQLASATMHLKLGTRRSSRSKDDNCSASASDTSSADSRLASRSASEMHNTRSGRGVGSVQRKKQQQQQYAAPEYSSRPYAVRAVEEKDALVAGPTNLLIGAGNKAAALKSHPIRAVMQLAEARLVEFLGLQQSEERSLSTPESSPANSAGSNERIPLSYGSSTVFWQQGAGNHVPSECSAALKPASHEYALEAPPMSGEDRMEWSEQCAGSVMASRNQPCWIPPRDERYIHSSSARARSNQQQVSHAPETRMQPHLKGTSSLLFTAQLGQSASSGTQYPAAQHERGQGQDSGYRANQQADTSGQSAGSRRASTGSDAGSGSTSFTQGCMPGWSAYLGRNGRTTSSAKPRRSSRTDRKRYTDTHVTDSSNERKNHVQLERIQYLEEEGVVEANADSNDDTFRGMLTYCAKPITEEDQPSSDSYNGQRRHSTSATVSHHESNLSEGTKSTSSEALDNRNNVQGFNIIRLATDQASNDCLKESPADGVAHSTLVRGDVPQAQWHGSSVRSDVRAQGGHTQSVDKKGSSSDASSSFPKDTSVRHVESAASEAKTSNEREVLATGNVLKHSDGQYPPADDHGQPAYQDHDRRSYLTAADVASASSNAIQQTMERDVTSASSQTKTCGTASLSQQGLAATGGGKGAAQEQESPVNRRTGLSTAAKNQESQEQGMYNQQRQQQSSSSSAHHYQQQQNEQQESKKQQEQQKQHQKQQQASQQHDRESGVQQRQQAEVKQQKPQAPKTRRVHWEKLELGDTSGTIWALAEQDDGDDVGVDKGLLEETFRPPDVKRQQNTESQSEQQEKKDDLVRLVSDQKRAENVQIRLSRMRMNLVPDVVHGLKKLDGESFSQEQIEILLYSLPTTDERRNVEDYLKGKVKPELKGDTSKLGSLEYFFASIVGFRRLEQRLKALDLTKSWNERKNDVQGEAQKLIGACDDVAPRDDQPERASRALALVLKCVLHMGNHLNTGTFRGGARGFSVDFLLKMKMTKGADQKTNLLFFAVQQLKHNQPVALRLSDELAQLKNYAEVSLDHIQSSMRDLSGHVDSLKEEMQIADPDGGRDPHPSFHAAVKPFLEKADAELSAVKATVREAIDGLKRVHTYLGHQYDSNDPTQVLRTLKEFVGQFEEERTNVNAYEERIARMRANDEKQQQQKRSQIDSQTQSSETQQPNAEHKFEKHHQNESKAKHEATISPHSQMFSELLSKQPSVEPAAESEPQESGADQKQAPHAPRPTHEAIADMRKSTDSAKYEGETSKARQTPIPASDTTAEVERSHEPLTSSHNLAAANSSMGALFSELKRKRPEAEAAATYGADESDRDATEDEAETKKSNTAAGSPMGEVFSELKSKCPETESAAASSANDSNMKAVGNDAPTEDSINATSSPMGALFSELKSKRAEAEAAATAGADEINGTRAPTKSSNSASDSQMGALFSELKTKRSEAEATATSGAVEDDGRTAGDEAPAEKNNNASHSPMNALFSELKKKRPEGQAAASSSADDSIGSACDLNTQEADNTMAKGSRMETFISDQKSTHPHAEAASTPGASEVARNDVDNAETDCEAQGSAPQDSPIGALFSELKSKRPEAEAESTSGGTGDGDGVRDYEAQVPLGEEMTPEDPMCTPSDVSTIKQSPSVAPSPMSAMFSELRSFKPTWEAESIADGCNENTDE